MTSPRKPCGFVTKPTSSNALVDEVDVDLGAILRRRGAHNRADGVGHAPTPADHTTHVARANRHLERRTPTTLGGLDANGVGIVDQLPDDELGDRHRGWSVAHAVAEPLNSDHAPDCSRSFCTRSVGLAPLRSQS